MDKGKFLLVLRGPSGSGKSSLSKAIQAHFGGHVAHLKADYFYWKICPQDKDKHMDNKPLVYRNLASLAKNYLEAGYSVIVEGLLIKIDEFGLWQELLELSELYNAKLIRIFLKVDFENARKRNSKKHFTIPDERILNWIKESEASVTSDDIIIDVSGREEEETVEKIEGLVLEKEQGL